MHDRDRRMRRAGGVDRRRRTPAAPRPAEDRAGVPGEKEIRDPVHQRPAADQKDRPIQARPDVHLVDPSGWRQGHARQVGVPRRRVRDGGRGDQTRQIQGLSGQHQLHPVPGRRRGPRRRFSRRNEEGRRQRRHHLARLRLRARARSGALPQSHQDQAAVPRHPLARQGRQGVELHPVDHVPRFPGRQSGLSLHAVGQPHPHGVWLAKALLSAGRGLRQDVQGTDGRHGLGRLRRRQLREMRRLHGPFRF